MDMHDLHLDGNCEATVLKQSLECAARLGYGVVAIGYTSSQDKPGKDKHKKFPFAPPSLTLDNDTKAVVGVRSKGFRQLTRVNMVLSEGSETHKLRQDNIQSYDLLAVQPTTEKMFHMACTKLEVDIICPDMTEKMPYYFKRIAMNAAVERGIYFEIPYAPAIRDATLRKNVLTNAMTLVSLCRGRNIIITSKALRPIEVRGPYDVTNLGLLFGLTEQQAKNAVSSNCRAVLFHAATRRNTIKSVMSLQHVNELTSQDRWKVRAGQEASGILEEALIEDDCQEEETPKSGSQMKKRRKSDSPPGVKYSVKKTKGISA